MILKPFFGYYGAKVGLAGDYPEPIYPKIIEPFCGSAGYSLKYFQLQIELYDTNPIICGVWDYLIHATPKDILNLPDYVDHVNEISNKFPQEARWLIGFNFGIGDAAPRNKISTMGPSSKWGRNHPRVWQPRVKKRIAAQVPYIRHWKVFEKSCFDIENQECTWFIDPPYDNAAGKVYTKKFTEFKKLGKWCRSRFGQVIVCEQAGSTWLPFRPFKKIQTCGYEATEEQNNKSSEEVIWTNEDPNKDPFEKFMVKK
jgi:hypothetical protein